MQKSSAPGPLTTILLYIFGILFMALAIVIALKGAGIVTVVPPYAIGAIALFAIGLGIVVGLQHVKSLHK